MTLEPLRRGAGVVPVALACTVVALQIAYPLTEAGPLRDRLTVATVLVFCVASVAHALQSRGARFAAVLVLATAGGGFVVEAVGVATGLPFGAYRYTDTLGWQVAGVPLVIALAWTMMAYPAYTVSQRIMSRPIAGARVAAWLARPRRCALAGTLLAAWALASWDLFLDPQMVDAGHWVWESAGPALVGIPLTNFAGWLVIATAMMAVVGRADPGSLAKVSTRLAQAAHRPGEGDVDAPQGSDDIRGSSPDEPGTWGPACGTVDDRVPYALYLWTYGSSVLAHAAFLGLPGSALAGGVGMGIVVVALVRALRR